MTQGRTWSLDGLGNWDQTETKVADVFTTDTASNTSFNEYYSFAGASQTHDTNGNLTSGTLNKYKWDGFNRLREVHDKNDNLIVKYLYDADNRRIRKDMASGTDIDYYYIGWRVLEERDNASTAPTRQFVYGKFIDEPLVMDVNGDNDAYTTGASDSRYFYHQNALYSVYGLSDSNGNIIEAYEFDPYGKHWVIYNSGSALNFDSSDTRTTSGLSNYGNPYLFTGRRYDSESSLQYSRDRYFATHLGRFISRDPAGYIGDPNLYQYAMSNSMRYIDQFGLACYESEEAEQDRFPIPDPIEMIEEVWDAFVSIIQPPGSCPPADVEPPNLTGTYSTWYLRVQQDYIYGGSGPHRYVRGPNYSTDNPKIISLLDGLWTEVANQRQNALNAGVAKCQAIEKYSYGNCGHLTAQIQGEMNIMHAKYQREQKKISMIKIATVHYKGFFGGHPGLEGRGTILGDHWAAIVIEPYRIEVDIEDVGGHLRIRKDALGYPQIRARWGNEVPFMELRGFSVIEVWGCRVKSVGSWGDGIQIYKRIEDI